MCNAWPPNSPLCGQMRTARTPVKIPIPIKELKPEQIKRALRLPLTWPSKKPDYELFFEEDKVYE